MCSILVVDDDHIVGEMIKYILEHQGYMVRVLKKPGNLQKYMLKDAVDLVLLDRMLKDKDGNEVCAHLKNDARFMEIPILMMSGQPRSRGGCLQAGASDFIDKPFERTLFLAKIDRLLKNRALTD